MSTKPQDAIAHAIEHAEIVDDPLDGAVEKAAADPGWPFQPHVLSCLANLKHHNPAAFEKLRAKFKQAGVRVGELDRCMSKLSGELQGRQPTQDELLLELAEDIQLFHSPDSTAYADIFVDGHRETWSLRSNGFAHRLRDRFYRKT